MDEITEKIKNILTIKELNNYDANLLKKRNNMIIV